ncbi:MAG: phosphatidylserine/phosphatidylglycerophosphate/cardiolipin synthase family protein [Verrucomicrobia bacterium]|nr:phosphatidylserine/phosphatidylglycerophosphate/cardiolipin synthase family protein [Verrucomicrobiota bacterium]
MPGDEITVLPISYTGTQESSCKERTGKLKERQVTYYPGFGEQIAPEEKTNWKRIAVQVAAAATIIGASAAIGFLVGNIPGAIIAAGMTAALIVLVATCKAVYDRTLGARFLMQLPKEVNTAPDTYKLGKYYEADVSLTSTADEGFEWKKKLIASATETIELSANFAGGSSFREILQLIDMKMEANPRIKTHIILSVDLVEKADDEMLSVLKKKFGSRFEYLKTDRHFKLALQPYTEENHVKMLVVDGKYFVGGGTSIHPQMVRESNPATQQHKEEPTLAAQALDSCARDMDIVGESVPLASVMRKQFFNLYRLWEIRTENKIVESRFFETAGTPDHSLELEHKSVRMKCIVGGPEHRGNNPIVGAYAKSITKAKKQVRLANWMFRPTKPIRDALEAARTGDAKKKIIGYIDGDDGTNSAGKMVRIIPSRNNYPLLDKVYEARTPDQTYHKKVATFDNSHMIIGSFNFSKKSANFDHEIVFKIKNERVTGQCNQILKEDARRANKITRETIEKNMVAAKAASFFVTPLVENYL